MALLANELCHFCSGILFYVRNTAAKPAPNTKRKNEKPLGIANISLTPSLLNTLKKAMEATKVVISIIAKNHASPGWTTLFGGGRSVTKKTGIKNGTADSITVKKTEKIDFNIAELLAK